LKRTSSTLLFIYFHKILEVTRFVYILQCEVGNKRQHRNFTSHCDS